MNPMTTPAGGSAFLNELEINVCTELTLAETGPSEEEAVSLPIEEWLSDPRFTINKERLANKAVLVPMLEEAFRTRNADEWVTLLEREEVPVGVVNTLDRVMKDPQIRHRNMVLDLDSGDGRRASVTGNPMKFRDTPPEETNYPGALGADTAAVLKDVLDLSPEEIAELLQTRTIIAKDA